MTTSEFRSLIVELEAKLSYSVRNLHLQCCISYGAFSTLCSRVTIYCPLQTKTLVQAQTIISSGGGLSEQRHMFPV